MVAYMAAAAAAVVAAEPRKLVALARKALSSSHTPRHNAWLNGL
jgi:hypothetical protein